MALPGVLARSLLLDLLIIVLEGLTVLLVQLFGAPRERGFSCSDASIRLPYLKDTVSTLALGLGFLVGAMLLMVLVELLLAPGGCAPSSVQNSRGRALPVWLVQLYRAVVTFLCGAGLSQMVTDIGKYHVGALRPHFLDVCEPSVSCSPGAPGYDPYAYIHVGEYECLGADKARIEEARVSFPSGHANISFYTATFFVIYLQARLSGADKLSETSSEGRSASQHLACFLLRPLLQGMALLAAWFTTVSRVMDHMHHFRDISVGGLSGALAAILIIRGLRPFRAVAVLDPYEGTPLQQLRSSGDGVAANHGNKSVVLHIAGDSPAP